MKKILIPVGIIAILAVLIYAKAVSAYNQFVQAEETINGQWAEVETQYQRRADLIPNLVNTVKGYADFEQETLTGVVEARAKATSVQIDPTQLTPEKLAEFQQVQDQLSGALSRLLVTVEKYPDLKANQNFIRLQDELAGTENRISVERRRYNESVQAYNVKLRSFPENMLAGMFGFQKKNFFEAPQAAAEAPKVKF